jgi:hypothetical protein
MEKPTHLRYFCSQNTCTPLHDTLYHKCKCGFPIQVQCPNSWCLKLISSSNIRKHTAKCSKLLEATAKKTREPVIQIAKEQDERKQPEDTIILIVLESMWDFVWGAALTSHFHWRSDWKNCGVFALQHLKI